MTKKCIGCGSILQNENREIDGYTSKNIEDVLYCERCFKIKNYGEYKKVDEKEIDFDVIYNEINNTNDLVLFLVDIFTLNNSLELINKYLNNNIILVITKKDLLPKSVKEEKIKKYLKNYNFNHNIIDTCIISSKKNYNIDLLYNMIKKYKTSDNVYVIGNTNAGKSTFINKMIYNYTDSEDFLTTSYNISTTLKQNKIKIDDELYLIDTPGIVEEDSVYNLLDEKLMKKIVPKKTIKPRTYQLDSNSGIYANDLFRLEYVKGDKNSFTIFISNDIIINRINIKTNARGMDLEKHVIHTNGKEDIMINGLCFIKVMKEADINLYITKGAKIYIRNSLI